MNAAWKKLIEKAYHYPSTRQRLLSKGNMYLYCDYSGFTASHNHGAACCIIHNRQFEITSKQLPIKRDEGSIYGELLAIVHSLDMLAIALAKHKPKLAVIYTDCSRIQQLLASSYFPNPFFRLARDQILSAIEQLQVSYPSVDVNITYMGKHKKNNPLHRLAHNAARLAAQASSDMKKEPTMDFAGSFE
ncbi:hypothetical protein FHS16_002359 [Paenibacillus endophyticus]|uniref:RNase H type-1 domain-containing protein n=1 Tax=Paenibacillus endophyticus TaxID=1294268 RepID=A0A7W5C6X9_9BACL|nr:hypothetical protein [Paenibacillus endophyticus]MBB3152313.1 hypothetical protein [Paenibacillus endophyticus]